MHNKIRFGKVTDVYWGDIPDEIYFSEDYKDYISNSRLSLIDPSVGGSPMLYKEGSFGVSTASLRFGDAVHKMFLQAEDYTISNNVSLLPPKLENILQYMIDNKLEVNMDNLLSSCVVLGDMLNLPDEQYDNILQIILQYYNAAENQIRRENVIYLTDYDKFRVNKCLESLRSNPDIRKIMYSGLTCTNEQTVLISVEAFVPYENTEKKVILKFKGKVDNLMYDSNTIIMNDLKTTSHIHKFNESIKTYHYKRQMGLYMWFLKQVFPSVQNVSVNIFAVSSRKPFESKLVKFTLQDLQEGLDEASLLIKRVAWHEVHGYDKEYPE